MTSDVSQVETDKIYDHILESLQQGRQPGTYKQMGVATGVHYRNIGAIIQNLSALGQLEASRPSGASKYSPLQYDIPGHDFPGLAETVQDTDPDIESRRLISEAMKKIRWFHDQGYKPFEIAKLVPSGEDTPWAESAIIHVINKTRPNYEHMLKAL